MNERIKKLAEQADCTIDKLGYGEGNLEKFAELIVRECADQCGNVLDYHAILERFGFEFKWSQE